MSAVRCWPVVERSTSVPFMSSSTNRPGLLLCRIIACDVVSCLRLELDSPGWNTEAPLDRLLLAGCPRSLGLQGSGCQSRRYSVTVLGAIFLANSSSIALYLPVPQRHTHTTDNLKRRPGTRATCLGKHVGVGRGGGIKQSLPHTWSICRQQARIQSDGGTLCLLAVAAVRRWRQGLAESTARARHLKPQTWARPAGTARTG